MRFTKYLKKELLFGFDCKAIDFYFLNLLNTAFKIIFDVIKLFLRKKANIIDYLVVICLHIAQLRFSNFF